MISVAVVFNSLSHEDMDDDDDELASPFHSREPAPAQFYWEVCEDLTVVVEQKHLDYKAALLLAQ